MNTENFSLGELKEALREYVSGGTLPMHMPGHKRRGDKFSYLAELGVEFDITEIDGFDDLHSASGILKRSTDEAAKLWGAKRSFYLVNGSTVGIHAAVRAACNPGDGILMARNCHKSVYAAAEINFLKPVFVTPEFVPDFGFYGSIAPDAVRCVLEAHQDVSAVIITSPTYEGVISDVGKIAKLAHDFGAALIVDEAHGAHLNLSPYFTSGAINAGADIVIQSLHKTLPSLTQTAVLHNVTERVSSDAIARQIAIFETSSPSYALLSSIDGCVRYLKDNGGKCFADLKTALDKLYARASKFKRLKVFMPEARGKGCAKDVYSRDKSRIYVSCLNADINGFGLLEALRERYAIEPEAADLNGTILLTSIADGERELSRLSDALSEIDSNIDKANKNALRIPLFGETVLSVNEIGLKKSVKSSVEDAVGAISAENICVYPPSIPILLAGQLITRETIEYLKASHLAGAHVQSSAFPDYILCLDE